jgi:hypothetical protein
MEFRNRGKLIAGIPVAPYGVKYRWSLNPGEKNRREFNQIEGDVIGQSGENRYRKSYILSLHVTG